MNKMRIFFFLVLYAFFQPFIFGMENVFYVLHDNKAAAIKAMTKYKKETHLIIAQSYHVNDAGVVGGNIDEDLLDFSKSHSIPLLAMITNTQFDTPMVHRFLSDPLAQKKALATLLDYAKKNKLAGVQFDFEMIALPDKKALTLFYQTAAEIFHKNGFIISFAIAPTLMDDHFPTQFLKKLYDTWQGVYDMKTLGEISDFVTIMSYDQHAKGTTPGAIASIPWDEEVIEHALKFIPANKISLGVPTYSGLWYMKMSTSSGRITIHYDAVSYQTVKYILRKFKPHVQWDALNKVNYTFYDASGINKYLFIEDAKSFAEKKALAEKMGLRGISVFRLGIEDPAIWTTFENKPWWKFWDA